MAIKLNYSALFAILLLSLNLSAQHRDTLYLYETQVIRDTIIVRDTIFQHDTLKIRHQAEVRNTTNDNNSVKNTLPTKADTSVKAVEIPVLDEGLSQKKDKRSGMKTCRRRRFSTVSSWDMYWRPTSCPKPSCRTQTI